jgi:hypothetical protein
MLRAVVGNKQQNGQDRQHMEKSDYIIYVDESGDHSLTSIDPQFPVFTLAFCII